MENAIRLGGGAFKKECKNMKTLIRNLKEVLERLLHVFVVAVIIAACYPML